MAVEIDKRNNTVVLSLGGNIGDVKEVFNQATISLNENVGELVSKSSIYQTKAWGVENQPDFLNQVLVCSTKLSPDSVLEICLSTENLLGRDRTGKEKWQERIIDIDVLFYESEIIKTHNLTIPHPLLHKRNFILFPLTEIFPDFIHPTLNKTVNELKKSCEDKLQVIKTLD